MKRGDVFDHMSRNGVGKCCMKLIPVDFYIQNCNIKAGIARSTSILLLYRSGSSDTEHLTSFMAKTSLHIAPILNRLQK